MLEHVALNQTRFCVPGISPDARGVVLGKLGVLLLPSLERLSTCLRLLSQTPMDDILPSLHIYEVRSPLAAREYLISLSAQSSHLLDRCGRAAEMAQGILYTGSSKHLVKYRDRFAPFGYDAKELSAADSEFILYGEGGALPYKKLRELSFRRLLLSLKVRAIPGGVRREIRELPARPLYALCEGGLGAKLCGYLWRNQVLFSGAQVLRTRESPLSTQEPETKEALLLQLPTLPKRMLELFTSVPGISMYHKGVGNFAVELGFRHPFNLASCQSALSGEPFYLFSARGVTTLTSLPEFADGVSLIDTRLELEIPEEDISTFEPPRFSALPAPPQTVSLRLTRAVGRAAPRATLVPFDQMGLFKRLVYALPQSALTSYKVSALPGLGLLVCSDKTLSALPLGRLLSEVAPAVFVPLGLTVSPQVNPEVLAEHLQTHGRKLLLLPKGGDLLQVEVVPCAEEHFLPLCRRILAEVPVSESPLPTDEEGSLSPQKEPPPSEPSLRNQPLSPFPLWGFVPS